jgi:hypothetical protein
MYRKMHIPFLPPDHPDQLQPDEDPLEYLDRIVHWWPLHVQIRDQAVYVVPARLLDEVHRIALLYNKLYPQPKPRAPQP